LSPRSLCWVTQSPRDTGHVNTLFLNGEGALTHLVAGKKLALRWPREEKINFLLQRLEK